MNYRQFEAGPDPFGRKFEVLFKWLQTAISLRHADTVDVKFVLVDDGGGKAEKTIAMQHADLPGRDIANLAQTRVEPAAVRVGIGDGFGDFV